MGGPYCGTNLQGKTIQSTGNALRFVFKTDESLALYGMSVEISFVPAGINSQGLICIPDTYSLATWHRFKKITAAVITLNDLIIIILHTYKIETFTATKNFFLSFSWNWSECQTRNKAFCLWNNSWLVSAPSPAIQDKDSVSPLHSFHYNSETVVHVLSNLGSGLASSICLSFYLSCYKTLVSSASRLTPHHHLRVLKGK